jgi:hypothetical protein
MYREVTTMKSTENVYSLARPLDGGRIRACALGTLIALTGCSVDATGNAGNLPAEEVEPASDSPSIVREPGSSAPVAARAVSVQRTLLHEVRHSETRSTRFWDLGYGELVVEDEGHLERDGLPPQSALMGSPLEIFERMGQGTPPAALVMAQARTDEINRRISERLSAGGPGWQLLPGVGPSVEQGLSLAAPAGRTFLGNAWWRGVACDWSDYDEDHYEGDVWFRGEVRCWDNPMAWVNSGSYATTKAWVAMYWGYGSDVTYKHWWVGCTDYVIWENCTWRNDTSTAKKGFYRTWNGGGLTTDRAGEIRTPNNNSGSAMFSIKTFLGF